MILQSLTLTSSSGLLAKQKYFFSYICTLWPLRQDEDRSNGNEIITLGSSSSLYLLYTLQKNYCYYFILQYVCCTFHTYAMLPDVRAIRAMGFVMRADLWKSNLFFSFLFVLVNLEKKFEKRYITIEKIVITQ